jgi:glycosyltransferase involved in cell wall biosynthesis
MAATNRAPTVSVTMCVFNGEAFVGQAIESILGQTFADLELIVVDDGSTDGTAAVLAGYSDPRLQVLSKPHLGIPKARNHALSQARGEFIAVLDADDMAHPTRLAHQVDYLCQHPPIVVLGSGYLQVDLMRNRTLEIMPPRTNDAIRRAMVTGNPICHSSAMIRRSALDRAGHYSESFSFSEDYELWSRLAQVGELCNLDEVLVTRRYHEHSVSNDMSNELLHLRLFWRVSALAIDRLGFPWLYRLLSLRSICLFLAVDLYTAAKQWWRQRFALRRGVSQP